MRVVFLTHHFPPEVGAPQTRIAAIVAGLRRRERAADGARIVRSAVYPAPDRGFARRLAGHLSLAASAPATAPASGRADVVVAESPPLFLAAAAVDQAGSARRARRRPLAGERPRARCAE